MSPFASVTSFVMSFLELLHVPHAQKNPVAKQIISISMAQSLSSLAKSAPIDAKALLDGQLMNETALTDAYGLIVRHIGEQEAKKILMQSLKNNMLEYAGNAAGEIANIEKEKIQNFIDDSTLTAVFDVPKAFLDLLSD